MTGIIGEIIEAVGMWIEGVFGWLGDAVAGIVSIFYGGAAGEEKLTVAGVLLLFGLGFTLVMFAFNFIKGLIRK